MTDPVDCMDCGEPLEECSCPGCDVCGGKTCEHLNEKAEAFLRLWAEKIREQLETKEKPK